MQINQLKFLTMAYHYSRKLKAVFDDVVSKITENLKHHGFSVVTCIDVQDTLKRALNIDFRKYKILGAFHPEVAFKAISLESHVGLLFPCHLVVQQHENGEVEISAISPLEAIEQGKETGLLMSLAIDVDNGLRAAVDELKIGIADAHHVDALPPEMHEDRPTIQG